MKSNNGLERAYVEPEAAAGACLAHALHASVEGAGRGVARRRARLGERVAVRWHIYEQNGPGGRASTRRSTAARRQPVQLPFLVTCSGTPSPLLAMFEQY